ncbi:MAG TPA: ABC transporter permease [Rhodothermales bacterium]|nr:ABC transporter permease [Rhodothermales bacterium]
MLRNYLTIALRNFRKHPGYVAINIAGLAIGLCCCILILLFVRDELSYDQFHAHADRIVRVNSETRLGDTPNYGNSSAYPLAELLTASFPEIEAATRIHNTGPMLMRHDEVSNYESKGQYAEPNFFDIFDFSLERGNPETALTDPYTVVMTADKAQQYFGDTDPMGQTVTVKSWHGEHDLTVRGILAPVPENSHLQFDFLISNETLVAAQGERLTTNWHTINGTTYLLLQEEADWAALDERIDPLVTDYVTGEYPGRNIWFTYYLQPLTDIHLNRLGLPNDAEGDMRYIYIFSTIALLILLIACINYMNLATARSAKRAKEVGMRKVLGAQRGQLARQFLIEAICLSVVAFMLAIALTELLLPLFNDLTGKTLATHAWSNPVLIGTLLGASLLTGVLAGSYPALFLSGFRPIKVLRSSYRAGSSGALLRKGLVVTQFACGVALIIGTLVIFQQLDYMQDKRLGFDEEQVIVMPLRDMELKRQHATIHQAMAGVSGVRSVTIGMSVPGTGGSGHGVRLAETPKEEGFIQQVLGVDTEYEDVMGMELVAGRWFDENRPADSSAYVINETAAQYFGLDEPLGRELNRNDNVGEIVGVVQDYHFASLHEEIKPLIIYMGKEAWDFNQMALKVDGQRLPETLAAMEAAWQQVAPGQPFSYSFLDEDLDQLYASEQRLGKIFGTFAFLGIFVACLGLLGLAAFTAEQRTKEIGIRKVFGAGMPGLVLLLSKDFLRLVVIAFVIAAPVGYVLMQRWLEDFAYRIELGASVFVLAGGLAVLIALLTVSYQAMRAALADPIKSLRYE